MTIILIDARDNFRNDVRTRLMLDDERDIELLTDLPHTGDLNSVLSKFNPDLLVIADNVVGEMIEWKIPNQRIVGYCTSNTARSSTQTDNPFDSYEIPCLGRVSSASHLLNLLELPLPIYKRETTTTGSETDTPAPMRKAVSVNSVSTVSAKPQQPEKSIPVTQELQSPPPILSAPLSDVSEKKAPSVQEVPPSLLSSQELPPPSATSSLSSSLQVEEESSSVQEKDTPSSSVRERLADARAKRQQEQNSSLLREQMGKPHKKAKVVTVYSAKGGVGKTTLSTELAVYLAMTSIGRGNCKVCLIDYNIDFGNVLSTLDFDSKGPNLSYWAAEIRERIDAGEVPEDITYSRKEIEERLQKMDLKSQHKAWIYSLIAPISHEDSMDIESEELEIILRNIVEFGEFDYVICDTGNNTRDSSIIALEAADYVLLVATQDVSTAYCNDAFLSTMQKIKFDIDKIRLVVNMVMPYKYTQIAVSEIEQMFPYQCIARFRRNEDVIKANNLCEPIAYQPNHEFTKELRNIVAFLTGTEVPAPTQKKGIFSKLFGKGE